ncbi:MAG: hypothetical protein NC131_18135, partial [Roseburia sp.]|nr:hypothetical protein [Roseburia sp.]
KMIGDSSLLKEMRFHNQMQIASIKGAEINGILNQTNWRQMEDGGASVLDGADGADIMQTHTKDVYAIIGGTNPTYERFIVSDQPFTYDGDEAKLYPAYAETPDYETVMNGVARSIRNDSVLGTHGAGSVTGCTDANFGQADAGGFPKTQLSRYMYEQYARAKNPDQGANLPYMNICNQDIELTQAFMFIEFRTKQLNNLLGHGISANATPTAQTWGQVSGFRLTDDNGATYRYHTFGTSMWPENATAAQNMWTMLNGSCPVLKMFEAQLAVSDGATLEAVKDSDGNAVAGKAQGVMTGIWTKTFSFNLRASLTQGGEVKNWKVDCVLRVPMWRGRTRLWGNLYQWYSGYECVKYLGEDGQTHHRLYRSPSIEALVSDNDEAAKSGLGQFAFETAYEDLGELPPNAVDYAGTWGTSVAKTKDGISTCVANETVAGASMFNYESACFYRLANALAGKFERRGVRFGGAYGGLAVLRFAYAAYAPSSSDAYFGSGFRVTLLD